MLARLHVLLPFSVTIPEGERFPTYSYTDEEYDIRIFPPCRRDQSDIGNNAYEILIDNVPAIKANVFRIDFQKDNFDRSVECQCDPPYSLISRTVNSFLLKLRFVTRGTHVRPINFPFVSWRLQYLNDDESELEKAEGFVRGRFSKAFAFKWTVLDKTIWEDIHKLPVEYMPPQWDGLILDAVEALPEVGPSVVLAATALEVFISCILDELAASSSIPKELWTWINNREWLREPATEEQFDQLLKILLGTSLKEHSVLWEAFKNLKTARNSFVHEGVAKIGGIPVTQEDARKLVGEANDIIKFVREKLPEELKWPEYRYSLNVEARKKLW